MKILIHTKLFWKNWNSNIQQIYNKSRRFFKNFLTKELFGIFYPAFYCSVVNLTTPSALYENDNLRKDFKYSKQNFKEPVWSVFLLFYSSDSMKNSHLFTQLQCSYHFYLLSNIFHQVLYNLLFLLKVFVNIDLF